MAEQQTIESYVKDVVREGRKLIEYMNTNGYYQPSFANGGFKEYPDLPDELVQSQRRLAHAAQAVADLANGPREYLRQLSRSHLDSATLRWLVHFRVPEAVPLHGSIAYAQVAAACDVPETQLRRILRRAMLNHLFTEAGSSGGDEVAHTPFSAALATDAIARACAAFAAEHAVAASAKLAEASERFGDSGSGSGSGSDPDADADAARRTAFQLATRSDDTFVEALGRAAPGGSGSGERLARALRVADAQPGFELQHVVQGFGWAGVQRVVEVGAALTPAAVPLVRAHPHLRVVVEDLPEAVAAAAPLLPDEVKGGVAFLGHDFFAAVPQPAKLAGAQVYLLRTVLRNHPDAVARQVLKGLVGFLAGGAARLLVVEAVVGAPGAVPPWFERPVRDADIELMALLGSRERQLDEWQALFHSVDEKLSILSVTQPPQSALSLMEVGFRQ